MLSINPSSNTERKNYKLLIRSIVPRSIAFVTSVRLNNLNSLFEIKYGWNVMQLFGTHHITAMVNDAQRTIDFNPGMAY